MRHVDIDLAYNRSLKYARDKLKEAGGFPVVIAPVVMTNGTPTVEVEGRGCTHDHEFVEVITWAYRASPIRVVRLFPAQVDTSRDS